MGMFKEMYEQRVFPSDWEYKELRRKLSEAISRGYVEQVPVIKKPTRFSLNREWYQDKETGEIYCYVAGDKPDAAARLATQIVALIEALKEHPYLGRAGSQPGVRELVVGGTPHLIFYQVRAKRVTITTIWQDVQSTQGRPKSR
jgi:plasmid stabilization system protein ParE